MDIRACERTDAEYEALEACHSTVWPEALTTADELSLGDRLPPEHRDWHRVVADGADGIVGYAVFCESCWFETPDLYFIDVAVHPGHSQQRSSSPRSTAPLSSRLTTPSRTRCTSST